MYHTLQHFNNHELPAQFTNLPASSKPASKEEHELTDSGNAARLAIQCKDRFAWVPEENTWRHWTGSHWRVSYPHEIRAEAARMATRLASHGIGKTDQEKTKSKAFGRRSKNRRQLNDCVELAKDRLAVSVERFDANPQLYNVENGTIELMDDGSHCFRRHNPADYLTVVTPVKYDSDATCPRFKQFLDETFGEKSCEEQAYMQKLMGYCLAGDTSAQALWIFYGPGENGKGVLIDTITYMLGGSKGYARTIGIQTLVGKAGRSSNQLYELAEIKGARFVTAQEPEKGVSFKEGVVKTITGQDLISARQPYGRPFNYRPQFKIVIATNHLPNISGTDGGVWRRMKVIKFDNKPAKRDAKLREKLQNEASGILAFMLSGWKKLADEGWKEPASMTQMVKNYQSEQDHLLEFLEACVTKVPHANLNECVEKIALYKAYVDWCQDNYDRPVGRRNFYSMMRERGYDCKMSNKRRHWVGIKLKDSGPPW